MGTYDPRQYKSGVQYNGRRKQGGLMMTDQPSSPPPTANSRKLSKTETREVLADMGIRDSDEQDVIIAELHNYSEHGNRFEYDASQLTTAARVFLGERKRREDAEANLPPDIDESDEDEGDD